MELESNGGEKIRLEQGWKLEVGRKANPNLFTGDSTVSRTQISLELQPADASKTTGSYPDEDDVVSFQVLGRNPVCVLTRNDRGSPNKGEIFTLFKKSERGYLKVGDEISFSVRDPKFFTLKGVIKDEYREILEAVERRRKITAERKRNARDNVQNILEGENIEAGTGNDKDLDLNSLDVSRIDPAKEFGFLVIGHEFDGYDKRKLRNIKDWKWFVEEPSDRSDDDEEVIERAQTSMKKRRKEMGDEDWTGECNDEKELITKIKTGKRVKSLRSLKANHNKAAGEAKPNNKALHGRCSERDTIDESDEDDDSLGGFIVKDEDLVEEQEEEDDDDEDEDFDENESDEE